MVYAATLPLIKPRLFLDAAARYEVLYLLLALLSPVFCTLNDNNIHMLFICVRRLCEACATGAQGLQHNTSIPVMGQPDYPQNEQKRKY